MRIRFPSRKSARIVLAFFVTVSSFAVLAAFLVATNILHLTPESRKSDAASEFKVLNDQQIAAINEYKNATSDTKEDALSKVLKIAEERGKKLNQVLYIEIQSFPEIILPQEVRKNVPTELISSGLIEQEIHVEGEAELLHMDMEKGSPVPFYLLHTKDRSYNLFFPKDSPREPRLGLSIEGIELGSDVYVQSYAQTKLSQLNQPARVLPPSANVVAIMANFTTNHLTFTKADADRVLNTANNSVKKFYQEGSFNKFNINTQIYGIYQLSIDYAGCNLDLDTLTNTMDEAAQQAGVPFPSGTYRLYIFPNPPSGCNIPSRGVGSFGEGRMWVRYNLASVYAHELGHVLGISHANLLTCVDSHNNPIPIDRPDSSNCSSNDAADTSDTMGRNVNDDSPTYFPNHFQAPYKAAFGWMSQDRIYTTEKAGDYIVPLRPHEMLATRDYQLIRVLKANETNPYSKPQYYYISMRTRYSFDTTGFVNNGVQIHIWNGKLSDYSLDPHYYAIESQIINTGAGRANGSTELKPGETFNDPYSAITIRYLGMNAGVARMLVGYHTQGAPTPPAPTGTFKSYLPQIFKNSDGGTNKFPAPGGPFISTFSIQNTADLNGANCSVYYYNSSGSLATYTPLATIAPNKATFISVDTDTSIPNGIYSVTISCDQKVAVVSTLKDTDGGSGSGAYKGNGTFPDTLTTKWYIPSIYNNYYNYYSNVVIQNPSDSPVTAKLTIFDINNNKVYCNGPNNNCDGNGETIGPHKILILNQSTAKLDPVSSVNKQYSGVITSSAPVAVAANIYGWKADGSIPTGQLFSIAAIREGSYISYAPVIMNNYYSYNTALTIQNQSESKATKYRVIYSMPGQRISDVTGTIPANSKAELYTPNNKTIPPGVLSAKVVSESATLDPRDKQPLLVLVNESSPDNRAASYTGFTLGSTKVFAPIVNKRYKDLNSSITCQNVGTVAATLSITYTDFFGNSFGPKSVSLAANQSALFYQPNDALPNGTLILPNGFNGSAVITSSPQQAPIICVVNQNKDEGTFRTSPRDFLSTYEGIGK